SAGLQKQLSTTSSARARRANVLSTATSEISVSGFDGVSTNNSFVFGVTAACHSLTLFGETKVVLMPNRGSQLLSSCTVAPNSPREATMWSPARAKHITQARIADMPDAVATQASAPSSAASRSCNMSTVGLV